MAALPWSESAYISIRIHGKEKEMTAESADFVYRYSITYGKI